jgi:hypothetical protein
VVKSVTVPEKCSAISDCDRAVFPFFMNFELGVLFFDKKTTILSCTYEGIGMFVDDWKINPISLLGGHGNRKIVQYGLLGSHEMDGVN